MSRYTEIVNEDRRYYCGAIVAPPRQYNRQCRRHAVVLFKEGDAVKACACRQHVALMREAVS